MTTMLILNLPPGLEEDLIDYLLSLDCVRGFTSYDAMGHGEHQNLTVAEQVSGRQRRKQFEILTEESAINSITDGLPEVGKDITYWQQPVLQIGRT